MPPPDPDATEKTEADAAQLSRLRKNYVGTPGRRWSARVAQQKNISAGCSKRPFSKAAASEEARRTLRYVEPLSDARTPLADFFSILLDSPQPHRSVGLAGLVEFLDMPSEGWAECGGEDCFSVGRDVVLELLDGVCQQLDQPLA